MILFFPTNYWKKQLFHPHAYFISLYVYIFKTCIHFYGYIFIQPFLLNYPSHKFSHIYFVKYHNQYLYLFCFVFKKIWYIHFHITKISQVPQHTTPNWYHHHVHYHYIEQPRIVQMLYLQVTIVRFQFYPKTIFTYQEKCWPHTFI
jgi:hypothetical protein